jgi:alkanesulfonate monooxygenase SsuD/methylene tetrahydromethanopterin reductase-like flavin-dependent oxidoreductase (luciferase family)
MKVGMSIFPQNPGHARPDSDILRECLNLADQAEDLGLDSIWSVEHHFTNYILMPDVVQFLTYMAGRTKNIELGTQVIVLPWHDPVRIAEQIALLDNFCGGRLIIGFGRGAATVEYDGFRVPMSDSRERFAEAAQIVMRALSNESFSYEGEIFKIPEMSVRPRPLSFPMTQFYGAAVSPASAEGMARLGLGVMTAVPLFGWEALAKDVARYGEIQLEIGIEPVAPITQLFVYVAETEDEAFRVARQYMSEERRSVDEHYHFSDGHLKTVKGYEHYGSLAGSESVTSMDGVDTFMDVNIVGTPETCLDRIRQFRDLIGFDHFIGQFSYGGMPYEIAERNLQLFASEVAPILQREPAAVRLDA